MTGPLRVLFLNRVYPPAEGATGEVLADLCAHLAADGFAPAVVTVGAGGETREAGVLVRRAGLAGYEGLKRAGTLGRAAGYLGVYPRLLAGALRAPRPSVLVTKTDPPLHLVLGPLLGRLLGVPAVHWAQDLYPEVAEALGVLASEGRLARGLRALSTWALRRHARVVVIGACMRARVEARGVDPARIVEIPNWALGAVRPIAHHANAFRREHGLEGRFVVMYSGNMGLAHPFEAMLDAAEALVAADPRVLFLFVGGGARRAWIEAEAKRRGLGNVRLLPFQPRERLAESLSAADLHLVSMEPELTGLVVPSKIYGVAAAGRPCVFLGPEASEAARFVLGARCGDVLEHPDGAALAASIRRWHAGEAGRAEAGLRARRAAVEGRARSLAAFATLLREVAGERALARSALR